MSRPNSIKFLIAGMDGEQRVQKKGEYMRRIDCSHFGCCCLHKGTWRSTQTTRDLHIWATKCIEVDSGIFEHLLRSATYMSFLCDKFVA